MNSLWSVKDKPVYKPARVRPDIGAIGAIFAIACASFGTACSGLPAQADAPPPVSPAEPSRELRRQLDALIGQAQCSEESHCHSIGLGRKACGGPLMYLAWSSLVSPAAALQALAEKLRRAEPPERPGMVSDCAVTPDPGTACRPRATDGIRVCTLNRAGSAADPASRQ